MSSNHITIQPSNHFNPSPSTVMHVDLNSCFATIEQQANPRLRGKPVAVAAYTTGNGCILAASREAKKLGIKTGMRVRDGKQICPFLTVLSPDPEKYRFVNQKLVSLLSEYTPNVCVKSIDEMVMDLKNTPRINCYMATLLHCYKTKKQEQQNNNSTIQQWNNLSNNNFTVEAMIEIGKEIKFRIKEEIGEWLTVSIGIAPNRYLAKICSGLHKPDGLDVIDKDTIEKILGSLALEDLCGIKKGNGDRLRIAGITSALDFYRAEAIELKRAFRSVTGFSWWMRLHGFEEDPSASSGQVRKKDFTQKSFGQSYALPKPYLPTDSRLHQILTQLVAKMGRRLRADGFTAGGIGVSCFFANHTYWQHGEKLSTAIFADKDMYQMAITMLREAQGLPVRILAVNCFDLTKTLYQQQTLFVGEEHSMHLTQALDAIHDRWGDFMVVPARMLGMEHKVLDRIAFGGVKYEKNFTD